MEKHYMTFLESLNLNFSRKWQESFSKPFETNMNNYLLKPSRCNKPFLSISHTRETWNWNDKICNKWKHMYKKGVWVQT